MSQNRRNYNNNRQNYNNNNYQGKKLPLPTKPPYQVYVGNLPAGIIQSDVEEIFEECDVLTARLVYDRESSKFKGFGYVEFNSIEGLKKALEFHGAELEGNHIKVDIAEQKNKNKNYNNNRRQQSGNGGYNNNRERRDSNMSNTSYQSTNNRTNGGYNNQYNNNRYNSNQNQSQTHNNKYNQQPQYNRQNSFQNNDSYRNQDYNQYKKPTGYMPPNADKSYRNRNSDSVTSKTSINTTSTTNWAAMNDSEVNVPMQRKRLNLKPRTKPIEKTSTTGQRNSSIFGSGRPRDESLIKQMDKMSLETKDQVNNSTTRTPTENLGGTGDAQ